jgi:hemerythrin superfamily protein
MRMGSTLNKVSKSAKRMLKSKSAAPAQDILKTLKEEHDEVKSLLGQLEKADAAADRRALVKQIKAALVPHTKAEEKVVYNAVIALKDKDAQEDGHEGYFEHECASRTLQKLDAIRDAGSPEHRAAGKVLKELVEHHIEEEEDAVWSDVKENFGEEDRQAMNRAFISAKARLKVH